jgi:hypothetical protein
MSGESAVRLRETAEAIADDLRGAGFYRDPAILADFLEGQLGSLASREAIKRTAEAIADDLRGAGYYRDPAILAKFLERTLLSSDTTDALPSNPPK